MIANLRETTEKNAEQDWLKTNLAKFSPDDAGSEGPRDRLAADHEELTPLVSGAARRLLHCATTK